MFFEKTFRKGNDVWLPVILKEVQPVPLTNGKDECLPRSITGDLLSLRRDPDPEDMKSLDLHLGVKYVLKASISDMREADSFDQIDPNSLIYPIPRTPISNSSVLNYLLVETSSGEVVYRIQIATSASEFPRTTNNGLEEYYNIGSSYATLRSGARRGTRYIVADCSCPKKKLCEVEKIYRKVVGVVFHPPPKLVFAVIYMKHPFFIPF